MSGAALDDVRGPGLVSGAAVDAVRGLGCHPGAALDAIWGTGHRLEQPWILSGARG